MRQQRASNAATAQHAASDEEAQQAAVTASALAFVIRIFVVVVFVFRAALVQKMGEQRATYAATP
jgi:hypothetical protein